jgi:hypothetical protein
LECFRFGGGSNRTWLERTRHGPVHYTSDWYFGASTPGSQQE